MRIITATVCTILFVLFGCAFLSRPMLIDGSNALQIHRIGADLSQLNGGEYLVVYTDTGKIDYSIRSTNIQMEGSTMFIDFYARKNFIPRFLWSQNKTTFSDFSGVDFFTYQIDEEVEIVKVRYDGKVLWDRNKAGARR